MAGIEINVIEYLRANLRDRYKNCYAVLKELLQNADDAGATELHVAAIDRIDQLSHALLQGPLLVVVNNAGFTYCDSCAIHHAGMGSKGLEENKIGKFGLGLKSVFHLCEAFFYLSDPLGDDEQVSDKLKRYGRTGILNPWMDEDRYATWNTVSSEDETHLGEIARSLVTQEDSHWFALCLPLRKKHHCIENASDDPACWAIDPKWYGDQPQPPTDIFSDAHFDSICKMLPLMSTLARVCFWQLASPASRTTTLTAEITRRTHQHVDWRTMSVGRQAMAGAIHLTTEGMTRTQTYVGVQHRLERQDLQALSERQDWPWMDAHTQSGRRRGPADVKQHAATILLESSGSGDLHIERAVFLPLGDPSQRGRGIGGAIDFELLLHGTFFVDAGRLCVDFASEQEKETARQEWNRILYREATLPLIKPALAEYAQCVTSQKDGNGKLEVLTTLLKDSFLSSEHSDQMCCQAAWGYRLLPEGGRWCQAHIDLPLALLPGDEHIAAHIPFAVFPALRERAVSLMLTFDGMPRLTSSTQVLWPSGLLAEMFRSVPVAEVAMHDAQLSYLVEVSRAFHRRRLDRISAELQSLLRRILRDVPLPELRKRRDTFAQLVALLPASMIVPIPFKQDLVRESDRLLECLIKQPTSLVPVPEVFCNPATAPPREATTQDIRALLIAVSTLRPSGAQEDAFHSLLSQAITALLSVWSQGEQRLVEDFGDLPLFYVKDYALGRRRAVTAHELRESRELRLLFGRNALLCKRLQDCLLTEQLQFVAEKEMTDLLAKAIGPVPSCDISGCAALLELRPDLNTNIDARRSLLAAMLPALVDSNNIGAVDVLRYLLHGNPHSVPVDMTLFTDGNTAWSAAARWALAASGQLWRLIPAELTDLKPSDAVRLGLRRCDATTVPALFRDAQPAALNGKMFAERSAWRKQIIREWPDSDTETLKQLPLFVRIDGQLTSITDQTFIQGALPPPPASIFPKLNLIADDSEGVAARRLAPTLVADDILRKILVREDCRQHWQFILDSIPETVSPELKSALQAAAWIPRPDGQGVAPRRIVSRDGPRECLGQLGSPREALIHKLDLPRALIEHRRWQFIESLGPCGDELYRLIGESVVGAPAYAVGRDTVQADNIVGFLRLFGDTDGIAVMPAAGLIQRLVDGRTDVTEVLSTHILPAVRAPLDVVRTRNVLEYLSHRHEQVAGPDRTLLLEIFNLFLKEGLAQAGFAKQLASMRFLNKDIRWCSAEQLAASGDNIATSHLLHASHFRIFADAGVWRTGDGRSLAGVRETSTDVGQLDRAKLAASAKVVGDYLETWRNEDVPDDALAAVVAVLGNCDGYPEQYERFRDSRPLDAMRKHFKWHFTPDVLDKWMNRYHYCILPASASKVRARNLFGDDFEAPVDKRLTSLFDGFGHPHCLRCFSMPGEEYCFQIWLRQIAPEELSREDKLEILGRTVKAIRDCVYGEWDEDEDGFATAWQQLIQVGQLEIEIAEDMILESSAMLLESQLSVRQSAELKRIFTQWHRVRQRAKTAEHANNRSDRVAAEKEKGEVLEELRALLVSDVATQHLLLSEVCKKLKDNSYSASSIPFELFQNGDDAVVELESLCEDQSVLDRLRPPELRCRFCIDCNPVAERPVLRFVHWGRGINQFRVGTVDGRDRDFDRDMERMLVLQGSGKDESFAGATRTGKFGLGFKSVFFVCDEPHVLSGACSRFRVLGGIYPARLASEDEGRLEEVLERAGDAEHKGTVVELPLRDPICVEQSLSRFQQLAGYLVVFARRIRQCNLSQANRPEVVFSWRPRSILRGIECGIVRTGANSTIPSLVFRLGSDGYSSLLVSIGANGVDCEANLGIPTIWVTTPTEHSGPGALVVNGYFDVNPGRTQLRETQRNTDLALQMGHELGEQLCRLYDVTQKDWETVRQEIGCPEASRNDFWSSFWNACLPYTDQIPVLRHMLFGSEHVGVYRLAREAEVIPAGLPGKYGCVTSLKNIRWRTQGALNDDTVWTTAAETTWVKKNIRPGTIITHSVAQSLDGFCRIDTCVLTLATILREAMYESQFVTPDMANNLGKLIFPARLREILSARVTSCEGQGIREVLALARFRTAAGGWSDADSLLIGHMPENRSEEHRRAAFAPAEKVLAEYWGDGLEFFLACRKERQASAEQMARWLLNAEDDTKRKAGLEYLERGELSFALRECLTEDEETLNASWLGDRGRRQRVMSGMDADRQAMILGMLRKATEIGPVAPPPNLNATRSTADILRDILAWWRADRNVILAYHDRTVYPAGRLPQLSFTATQAQLQLDVAVRKQWLILFMLGSMHRIGRATRHQGRGFLELCENNGWLDDLAGPTDDPTPWFHIMDDYLDSLQGESKYFHWMNQFLAYYQLARWLPTYARVFEAVTRPGVNLADLRSIRDIADLRTSHMFSGSTGFDAPPCSRMMGVGSHFVLREVIRARAAQSDRRITVSERLARFAFVPSAALRRLMAQITRNIDLLNPAVSKEEASCKIADILHDHLVGDAAFDHSFDIPLLALTWSRFADTRRRILGIDDGYSEEDPVSFLYDEVDNGENEE